MTRMLMVVVGVVALLGTGCGIKTTSGAPAMQAYDVAMAADGVVPVPELALGRVSLPVGTTSLAQVGLVVAGMQLAQMHGLDNCTFALATPPDVPGAVVVAATATCTLRGLPVTESVRVAFRPVVADAVVAVQ